MNLKKHSPSQGCAFLVLSLFLIFFPVVVELDQSDAAPGAGLLIQRRNMPVEHRAGDKEAVGDLLHAVIGQQQKL